VEWTAAYHAQRDARRQLAHQVDTAHFPALAQRAYRAASRSDDAAHARAFHHCTCQLRQASQHGTLASGQANVGRAGEDDGRVLRRTGDAPQYAVDPRLPFDLTGDHRGIQRDDKGATLAHQHGNLLTHDRLRRTTDDQHAAVLLTRT